MEMIEVCEKKIESKSEEWILRNQIDAVRLELLKQYQLYSQPFIQDSGIAPKQDPPSAHR